MANLIPSMTSHQTEISVQAHPMMLVLLVLLMASAPTQAMIGSSPILAPVAPPPALPAHGWLTLESPHFLVHFPPGHEHIARRIALAAENAHRNLVPKMQYLPEEKTHIVVADISDAANAFTRVTPYNHILVYPVPPDTVGYDTGLSPTHQDWFAQLMLHEYAHVLQLDMHAGNASYARRLFGKVPWASTPNSSLGYALLEGHAVFAEGLTGTGRGDGAFYDMFLRAAVLDDVLPSWDQVIGNYNLTGWNPGPAVYLYGYSFLDYVARTYGEERLGEVYRLHSGQPLGTNGAISRVLQIPFDDLWEGWQEDLLDRYSQQREALGPVTQTQTVDTIGDMVLWPTWSPDGEKIVYGSSGNVLPSLRLRQVVDGQPKKDSQDRRLTNGQIERSGGFSWTPDAQEVVYGKMDYRQGSLTSDLYMLHLQSGKQRRLTHGYRAYAPSVSPNGEWVAFIARREDKSRILLAALDDVSPMVLWSPETDERSSNQPVQALSLAWSPSGDALAFVGRGYSGEVDLFLMPLAGQDVPVPTEAPIRLTHDMAAKLDPAWSPDGRYLFFSSDRSGIYNIHAYDMHSCSQYQVTRALYGVFAPSVSPDGTTLLLSSYSSEGYQLATLALAPEEWELCPEPTEPAEPAEPAEPQIFAQEEIGEQVIRLPSDDTAVWSFVPRRQLEKAEGQPWERDVAQPLDPHDFVVRRYRAIDSLSPRYWLPVWGGAEGRWVTGGSTSSVDALGQHAYAVAASFGGDRAAYRAEYEFRSGPLGSGPVLGFSLSGSPPSNTGISPEQGLATRASVPQRAISPVPFLRSDGEVTESQADTAGELYVSWQKPGVLFSSRGVTWVSVHKGEEVQSELGVGVSFQSLGGNGHLRRVGDLRLYGVQALTCRNTAAGLSWSVNQAMSRRLRVSMDLSVVAGTAKDSFSLGGTQRGLAVRGLPVGYAKGQGAGTVSLEAEYMAFPIQRGAQDSPLFLDGVSWALFCDGGVAGNRAAPFKKVATAGVEARATGTLGYGLTRGDLRLGVARALDGAQPWRVYWGIGSGF
ncbi:MAG: TolB family protein [Limnochordia bacterium]|jgi:Tol biopolymer transport system component